MMMPSMQLSFKLLASACLEADTRCQALLFGQCIGTRCLNRRKRDASRCCTSVLLRKVAAAAANAATHIHHL